MAGRKKTERKTKETAVVESGSEMKLGSVSIADEVVSSIATIAASEVDGVASEIKNGVAQSGSAKVRVTGKNVDLLLNITISYGHNIPETCGQVQSRVRTAVENMTGLMVKSVNIKVVGAEIGAR
ncbi:MAG: Asp23/Gls24 family envelope stress response protein [Lachnospiraceae bacterium]|nr:Asp23/Gls24 family envelope stress response protein [Lachnospiraceae bacterium]